MAYIIVGALAAIIDFKEPTDASAKYAEKKKGTTLSRLPCFCALKWNLMPSFEEISEAMPPHVKGVTEHATIDIDAVRMLLGMVVHIGFEPMT